MTHKIQVRRGLQSMLPVLDTGEFGFTTDQQRTYIGSPQGNVELAKASELAETRKYPVLLDEVGVTNKSYPYGDVKRYGANGLYDENKDDTQAFQNAIDSSFALKKSVDVSPGIYSIKNTLYLPPNIEIRTSGNRVSYRGLTDGTVINTYTNEVFKPKTGTNCVLEMENLYFHNRHNKYSVLFSGFNLVTSTIRKNNFHSYGIIFLSGIIGISVIENNDMQGIAYSFMAKEHALASGINTVAPSGLIDSYILNNYINGDTAENAVAFRNVQNASSTIRDNFIDFFMIAFDQTDAEPYLTMFKGNIIDYCYRGFVGKVTLSSILDNTFFHIQKSQAYRFPNATNDMTTGDWIAICADSEYGFNRINVSNNFCENVDVFLFVRGRLKHNVNVKGNTYSNTTKRIDYVVGPATWVADDQKHIVIDDLMDINVTTLPSASLSSEGIVSFNRQRVFYNKKQLTNIDGNWYDTLGVIVSS